MKYALFVIAGAIMMLAFALHTRQVESRLAHSPLACAASTTNNPVVTLYSALGQTPPHTYLSYQPNETP